MTVAAIVPAAGRGERLGPGTPKALRLLGGAPMLVHATRALAEARLVDLVVVAAPEDRVGDIRNLLVAHDLTNAATVVAGGPTRHGSVRNALAALPDAVDLVLVHDAARPLAPPELADAVVRALQGGADVVVPVLPVVETVKRVDAGGHIVETLPRERLRATQTPQGFRRPVLLAAYDASDADTDDDLDLVLATGAEVDTVPGHDEAFAVDRPSDLLFAEAMLARRRASVAR